jgi:TonB-linked SusC/RagA family outer membrane protein
LAVFSEQNKDYDWLGVEATGFSDDRIHEVTAHGSDPSDISSYGTRKISWSLVSYLSRISYSYKDRYSVTGSIRADGSSKFGKNGIWGYFPSLSACWIVSEEPFFKKSLGTAASVKLRASWGESGNNNIGDYNALPLITYSGYAIGGTAYPAAYENKFVDADLGWETTTQANLGTDIALFDKRLNLTANWYDSITRNILYNYPISSISGSTVTMTNLKNARIRNMGLDFQIDATLAKGKLNWTASTNFSFNRNKVISLGGLDDIISISERSIGSHITKEGYPIGCFYGYKAIGIMSETDYNNALLDREVYLANGNSFPDRYHLKGPAVASYSLDNLSYGNTIWKDVNGDGIINTADKAIIGKAYPDFTGGFSTDIAWKSFDARIVLSFSYGGEVINFQDYYLYNMEGSANQYSLMSHRYRSDSDPGYGNIPIATRITTTNNSLKLPSYYIEDASFLRCSNITAGYSLPNRIAGKLHAASIRLFASIDNLFTLTGYNGYNPEVSYNTGNLMPGFDMGCYPLSRTYSIGLDMTF